MDSIVANRAARDGKHRVNFDELEQQFTVFSVETK